MRTSEVKSIGDIAASINRQSNMGGNVKQASLVPDPQLMQRDTMSLIKACKESTNNEDIKQIMLAILTKLENGLQSGNYQKINAWFQQAKTSGIISTAMVKPMYGVISNYAPDNTGQTKLKTPKKAQKYKSPTGDILHDMVKDSRGRITVDPRAIFKFMRLVRPTISKAGEYCQEPYEAYLTGREWESERIHAKGWNYNLIKKQLDKIGFDGLFLPNGLLECKEGKGFNSISYNMKHAHEVGKSLIAFEIYLQHVPDPTDGGRPMKIYSLHENNLMS